MFSHDREIQFYKIIEENCLRNDGELMIPHSFVSKYWEGMSNPLLLQLPNGATWKVNWGKHGVHVWLSNKYWKKFAEFYSLDQKHLMLFRYDPKSLVTSTFRVSIFDQSGLEIVYPSVHESSGDQSDKSFENRFPTHQSKRPKSPTPFSRSPKKMKTNPKEDPKMKTNHADFDNTKTKNRGKGVIFNNNNSALERAKAFRTKNPSFIREMRPSYIQRHLLAIPGNFITTRQQKENEIVTLWVSEERTWDVKFKLNTSSGQISLNAGWQNFVKDNNLKLGDVCVFEQTNKSRGVSFRVVIFRAREESSPPDQFQDPEIPRNDNTMSKNHFTFFLKPKWGGETNDGFFRKYVIDESRDAKLLVGETKDVTVQVGKRSWPVKLYPNHSYAKFSTGWSAFVTECNLKTGDVCLFELVDNEMSVLRVNTTMSENHFTLFLEPTQLHNNLHIPAEFTRKHGIYVGDVKDVTLRVGKRSWPVTVSSKLLYASFCSRHWSAFVRDCNVKKGDVCRFDMVDKEKFVLQVTVSRCNID